MAHVILLSIIAFLVIVVVLGVFKMKSASGAGAGRRESFAVATVAGGTRRPCEVYSVPYNLKSACDNGLFEMSKSGLRDLVKRLEKDKTSQAYLDAKAAQDNYDKYPVCKFRFNQNQIFQYAEGGKNPDLIVSSNLGAVQDWAFCFAKQGVAVDGLVGSGSVFTTKDVYKLQNTDGSVDPENYSRFTFKTFDGIKMNKGLCKMYADEFKTHPSVTFPVLVYDDKKWYFIKSDLSKDPQIPEVLKQYLKTGVTEVSKMVGKSLQVTRKARPVTLRALRARRTPCCVDLQPMGPGDKFLKAQIGAFDGVVVDTISPSTMEQIGGDTKDKLALKARLLTQLTNINNRIGNVMQERDRLTQTIDKTLLRIKAFQESKKVQLYGNGGYTGWYAAVGVGSYNKWQLQQYGFKNDDLTSLRVPPGLAVILYEHDNFTGTSWVLTEDVPDLRRTEHGKWWNDKVTSIKVGSIANGKFDTVDPELAKVLKAQNDLVVQRDRLNQLQINIKSLKANKDSLLSRISLIQSKLESYTKTYEDNIIPKLDVKVYDRYTDLASYDGRVYLQMMYA